MPSPPNGSVLLVGNVVQVMPAFKGDNTVTVSNDGKSLNVNLNGKDHLFDPVKATSVYFFGQGHANNLTFINKSAVSCVAQGTDGANTFTAGSTLDVYYGGAGTNTFNAGSGHVLLVGGAGVNTFNLSTGNGYVIEGTTSDVVNGVTPSYTVSVAG